MLAYLGVSCRFLLLDTSIRVRLMHMLRREVAQSARCVAFGEQIKKNFSEKTEKRKKKAYTHVHKRPLSI